MPKPRLSDELAQDAINLVATHGGVMQAANAVGVEYNMLRRRHEVALARGMTPSVTRPFGSRGGFGNVVIAIPDLHTPYHHKDAFEFIGAAKDKYKPSKALCLGDEADQHAMSQYHSDPDNHSAGRELELAKSYLAELAKLFPVLKICHSNHGDRYIKKATRAGLPRAMLKRFTDVYESPIGWQWGEKWEIDGVVYEHGEGVSGPDAARRKAMYNHKPTVIGHIHAHAGIQYLNNGESQIWGMNTGCLIDFQSYSFRYAKHYPFKPVLGLGIIDHGVPHFIPMILNDKGRWNGKV